VPQGKRVSEGERVKVDQRLAMGVPLNMSVEGATKMDKLVAYLYRFRVATLEQLARCLPDETEKRIGYWLTRYPFINKQMTTIVRYDSQRHRWIRARKKGIYTLPASALIRYEVKNEYVDKGYTDGNEVKVEHKPKNAENLLHVVELITKTMEIDQKKTLEWISNQMMSIELKKEINVKSLGGEEKLSTAGFIYVGDSNDMWGIGIYINQISAVLKTTKLMFPSKLHRLVEAIMLVRNEHLGRIHEIALKQERSKGVNDDLYFRFVPYEFSLEHPKWFLSLLHGNRWGVLDALIENVKYRGGVVEEPKYHPFHYRVTHADGQIEYIDTSYGAPLMKMIDMLTHKATERAMYTLYVSDKSEIESYKTIVRKEKMMTDDEETLWITFRLIDWPGGTK
jgi:hypothetical protein